MGYSIEPVLHPHVDKHGRQKVQIRIIFNRAKVYLKTDLRVAAGTTNAKIDSIVRKQIAGAEDTLLDAIREGLTVAAFKSLFKKEKSKSVNVVKYFKGLDGQGLAPGTIRQRKVTIDKIPEHTTFSDISVDWLKRFENKMRDKNLDGNTINSNLRRLKTMLRIAAAGGMIKKEVFENYKSPPYVQKLVDYLTESEIGDLSEIVFKVKQKSKRLAGFYFLLSCYTGWRIGDAKKFNPGVLRDGRLIIRASKNKRIVSIPIHSRLKEVIKFCNKNPFDLSEEKARLYVKELCRLAGITWNVKFHSARHSFAMLLMANGFTKDEVAELIGDSLLITKVYARIHNPSLDKKIRERLG